MYAYVYLTSKSELFDLKQKLWQIYSLDDSWQSLSLPWKLSEGNIKGVLHGPR